MPINRRKSITFYGLYVNYLIISTLGTTSERYFKWGTKHWGEIDKGGSKCYDILKIKWCIHEKVDLFFVCVFCLNLW